VSGFLQFAPSLPDAWASDRALREALEFHLGSDAFARAEPELAEMGRVATDPATLAFAVRAESEPPRLVHYDAWGKRIDEIVVSDAYTELGRVGVEAGITALPYEDTPYRDGARLVWAGLLALWGPSSALYSCPVAMTDGAARTLLIHGDENDRDIVGRLTTRDPSAAWTSGQWMTETAGGSDVGRTGTIARRAEDGSWRLTGTKWFTSSTTSEMALTLARPAGAPEGSRGLALFRIHRHLDDGTRNSILVRRLKDKLGTRALTTAELELQDAIASPVGDVADGGGVRRIATMLNITRIHNALGGTAAIGRGLAWARAFASVREAFGQPLHLLPAHVATLSDMAVDYAASLALTLRCCELMGRVEHDTAGESEQLLLRVLTPITKLASGRWSIAAVTEAMEAIGGVGYCEDSTIPTLVRNTHVIPIWEGTTNVMALDFMRAVSRGSGLETLLEDAHEDLEHAAAHSSLSPTIGLVAGALDEIATRAEKATADAEEAQYHARALALSVARTYACARLCAQGAWAAGRGDLRTASTAARLAHRGLLEPEGSRESDLAMDDHPAPDLRGR
jgi:alkylation response protein AidB-like acyl-CoA dehydrogenase